MATLRKPVAQHWRDREIARSETISDAWQVFLAYAGRGAEIILFICMAVSLVQMIPGITLPDTFTGVVFVIQMITLDVAGFGLTSLAKAVGRMGDAETARRAGTIGTCLIIIMIISMLSGGISRLFGPNHPDVKTWMGYVDDGLILIRIGMTVLYGKIMHSLRDSQQHMQQTEEDEQAALREEITRLQTTLQNERNSSSTEQTRLTTEITTIKNEQAEKVNELSQHLAEVKTTLETKAAELLHVQELLQNASQNAESETAKLRQDAHILETNLQTANLQIADLTTKLERAKKKIADLQNTEKESEKPAKSRTANQSADNITSIDQARTKNRMSHADVLAYMDAHPDLKRAEVAVQLGISERKVYDAIAWQRDQEQENAGEAAQ
jgi:hypothetical protein